jgi:hypothetical protein
LAIQAQNHDAWLLLSELRTLLAQHIEHLQAVAAGKLTGNKEFAERRSTERPADTAERRQLPPTLLQS